ncbi:MAG: response regulator transcription factor [Anaerolineae bacterium]|nr:response regulator transcription factor [Anaerolineae bacterium]
MSIEHSPAKIRVAVVDDHDMVRQGLLVLLENFDDFELVGDASDGEAAVSLCADTHPDVVLMDMIMPGVDGIRATKIILDRWPNTKVIALTSFNDENNVQNALKAGAISYLIKNVSIDDLADAIRRAYHGQATLAPEAAQALITATTRPPDLGHDLTEREREVLYLMVEGLNNREIGERLVISSSTVKNHVSSIFAKMGATSRTQAVALAVERRMFP